MSDPRNTPLKPGHVWAYSVWGWFPSIRETSPSNASNPDPFSSLEKANEWIKLHGIMGATIHPVQVKDGDPRLDFALLTHEQQGELLDRMQLEKLIEERSRKLRESGGG